MEAAKEKVFVNDGGLQRLLSNINCPKQRPETSAAKDMLLLGNATGLGNARRFLYALVSMSGGRLWLSECGFRVSMTPQEYIKDKTAK
jgi:hypothetical protein